MKDDVIQITSADDLGEAERTQWLDTLLEHNFVYLRITFAAMINHVGGL
jgi:hypothetical protein